MHTIGILPAAGYAKRLGLVTPKELLPITYKNNKIITCIEGSLLQLVEIGIRDAVIVIREGKENIRQYLGSKSQGVHIEYVYQKTMDSREGLCDALKSAKCDAEGYLMLMPDVYFTSSDIAVDLYNALPFSDADLFLSVWETSQPWKFGITRIHQNQVLSIYDKPDFQERSWFWGAVLFTPSLWPYIENETQTFSNAMNRFIADGYKALAVRGKGEYLDIGTPESLFDAMLKVNS